MDSKELDTLRKSQTVLSVMLAPAHFWVPLLLWASMIQLLAYNTELKREMHWPSSVW